jgi:hypothetical protein
MGSALEDVSIANLEAAVVCTIDNLIESVII